MGILVVWGRGRSRGRDDGSIAAIEFGYQSLQR